MGKGGNSALALQSEGEQSSFLLCTRNGMQSKKKVEHGLHVFLPLGCAYTGEIRKADFVSQQAVNQHNFDGCLADNLEPLGSRVSTCAENYS